jgi:outer membrane protein OmpA-like peptidoglycan-associated protein
MKVVLLSTLSTAALFATGCCSTQPKETARHSTPQTSQHATQQPSQQWAQQSDWAGERGPDGPAGARGPRGETGQAGPEGIAVAGPRGQTGPAGPAGDRGAAGARGPAGELVRGPRGEVGQAGASGAEGQMGQTGVRGASGEGFAGPTGPAGPEGPTGPAGRAGERGEALVGPAGAAGRAGPAGERGEAGQTGGAGATTAGVAGPRGLAGQAGPRGDIGPMGPVGPTGLVENWTAYREFWFDQNMTQVHDAERYQYAEIASYMRANPTLQLGIDNWASSGTSQNVRDSRFNAIRSSLVDAGVPSSSITMGSFASSDQRRDGRVGILLRTDREAHARAPSNTMSAGSRAQSDRSEPSTVSENWSTLHSFWFDGNTSTIHSADRAKVEEIVAYMRANPSLRLGIDSSLDSNNFNRSVQESSLARNRGEVVREALIAAGVPSAHITSGTLGDTRTRRDGRVEVLVRTDQSARAR